MKKKSVWVRIFLVAPVAAALTLGIYSYAAAHCDPLMFTSMESK